MIINTLAHFPLQFPLQKPQLTQGNSLHLLGCFFANFSHSIAILLHFGLASLQFPLQKPQLQTNIYKNA